MASLSHHLTLGKGQVAMNEYCYQVSPTRTVWVYAIDEEAAEVMVYEELGYDPDDMELVEVLEDR